VIETFCPLCAEKDGYFVVNARDMRIHSTAEYSYVRCSQCGLVRLNPGLSADEIAKAYPAGYHSGWLLEGNRHNGRNDISRDNLRRVNIICREFPEGGRALDVGCGVGTFMHLLESRGWQVCGTEYSAKAAAYARKAFNVDVRVGDLCNDLFEGEAFDLITMWHVIEHMNNPLEQLKQACRILKPGGDIVVATPNIDSLSFSIFRKYWYHLDAPRHLVLFTPATLCRLARKTGLEIIRVSDELTEQNRTGWQMSVVRLMKSFNSSAIVRRCFGGFSGNLGEATNDRPVRRAFIELSYSSLGVMAMPLVFWERFIKRPSCFELILKRPR
jgi:2-polyprenyl-3-methyl-5-hydroxy-6-metoxy-1,4-benzoquinol methylase